MSMCRQCHKTCLNNQNGASYHFSNNSNSTNNMTNSINSDRKETNDRWQILQLASMKSPNSSETLLKLDPFFTPVPQISVVPPTPDILRRNPSSEGIDMNCNCSSNTKVNINTKIDLLLRHFL